MSAFEKFVGGVLTAGGALFIGDAYFGDSSFQQGTLELFNTQIATGEQLEYASGLLNLVGGIMILSRSK